MLVNTSNGKLYYPLIVQGQPMLLYLLERCPDRSYCYCSESPKSQVNTAFLDRYLEYSRLSRRPVLRDVSGDSIALESGLAI